MLEALGEWMGYPLYYSGYGGTDPKRTGANHATIYPYGPFLAGDRKLVFLGIQNEREWERFCIQVLEKSELSSDSRFNSNAFRVSNSSILKEMIDAVFQQMNSNEIIEKLEKAKIANAHLNTVAEFINHPQLKIRKRWREVDSPAGKLNALIPPVTFEDVEPVMNPIPDVGEHTEAILKEFGFDNQIIEKI